MNGEQIILLASGYPWVCPACNFHNYIAEARHAVTCDQCGKTFVVEALVHKLGVSRPNNILLTPASYSFKCPQCEEINFIGAAVTVVICKKCNARLDATGLQHKIDSTPYQPPSDQSDEIVDSNLTAQLEAQNVH